MNDDDLTVEEEVRLERLAKQELWILAQAKHGIACLERLLQIKAQEKP